MPFCGRIDQAPPRVSYLATSTIFGSDPATEYLLTVQRTFNRSSMSISKTDRASIKGIYPRHYGLSVSNFYIRAGMRIPFAGTKFQILQLAVDFGTYFLDFVMYLFVRRLTW